jgi:acetolactate synthase-1/2/3 large subunit
VGLERTAEAAVLPKADLVVGMGLRPGEVLAVKPFACDAVNVDDMPPHDGFGFSATTGASAAADVLSELAGHEWGTTAVQFASAKLRMAMQSGAFLPAHVFEAVDHRFDGRVRAVFDTGYFCTIGEHVWRARRADWFLIAGLGRYMGTALPMALAAALHDNQVPTVAFLGDGGIGTYVGELRLAVRLKLPLLVVLLTDGGFSSLRTRAIRDGLTQKPLVMADPSWLGIVEALGIPGIRTKTLAAFTEALNAWTGTGGPAYLEVPFDPESYQGMMDGIR